MSEQIRHKSPEAPLPGAEALELHQLHEKHTAQASTEASKPVQESESSIRASIDKLAVSGREMAPKHSEHHSGANHHPAAVSRDIKALALQRTLKRAQRRLPAPERAISTFIHQPAVNRASEVGSKTIARPSGILGGGIVAFIGSTLLYVTSRRYGFEYNYSALLFLFGGGFLLGMILELALHARRKR